MLSTRAYVHTRLGVDSKGLGVPGSLGPSCLSRPSASTSSSPKRLTGSSGSTSWTAGAGRREPSVTPSRRPSPNGSTDRIGEGLSDPRLISRIEPPLGHDPLRLLREDGPGGLDPHAAGSHPVRRLEQAGPSTTPRREHPPPRLRIGGARVRLGTL